MLDDLLYGPGGNAPSIWRAEQEGLERAHRQWNGITKAEMDHWTAGRLAAKECIGQALPAERRALLAHPSVTGHGPLYRRDLRKTMGHRHVSLTKRQERREKISSFALPGAFCESVIEARASPTAAWR